MSLRICKGCGHSFRAGKLAFMLVGGEGKRGGGRRLMGSIVCPECASGGVLLVPAKLAPVKKVVEKRSDEIERALKQLRTFHKLAGVNRVALVSQGKDFAFWEGKQEGLEQAIALLEQIERVS